jgi:hypothetical protein
MLIYRLILIPLLYRGERIGNCLNYWHYRCHNFSNRGFRNLYF